MSIDGLIKSVNSLFKIKTSLKAVLKEESKRMSNEKYTETQVSDKLIEILDIDFEDAKTMIESDKNFYIGRFRIDPVVDEDSEYTFKINATVRKYEDGKAPWQRRLINPIEAEELESLIESDQPLSVLTSDQEGYLRDYYMHCFYRNIEIDYKRENKLIEQKGE